ncbi:hypothetical protein M422DRAFT_175893, partial [Sphaerobolus stellatus SS14]
MVQFPSTHILTTGFAPCPREAVSIRERVDEEKKQLKWIDKAIDTLEIVLRRLRTQREVTKTSCEIAEELVSPMRRLPVELMQNIFIHAVSVLDISMRGALTGHVRKRVQGESHPHCIRGNIVTVSRRWRDIAYHTAELWATIAI